jgi:hypothetical protein
VPIEAIQVGDLLPGGMVYTVQKSLAPQKLYDFRGHLMTGGHAVTSDAGWIRAKEHPEARQVDLPADKNHIYNLGVTAHFITLADNTVVGDLHETDLYEQVSDNDSLEMMNEQIPVCQIRS